MSYSEWDMNIWAKCFSHHSLWLVSDERQDCTYVLSARHIWWSVMVGIYVTLASDAQSWCRYDDRDVRHHQWSVVRAIALICLMFDGCSNHGWHRLMQCPDILMIIKHSIFTVNKNSQSFLVIYVQSSVNYFKINNCHFCLFIFQKRPIEKQR